MKLHLPKQLFTALLAALTLAAPAALTLGSAAWGEVTVITTDGTTTVSNTEGWSRTYTSIHQNTTGENGISDTTYNSTKVGATIVTGGRLQINGGTAATTSDNLVSAYGGDLITGGSGHFFLQTWGKGQIDLSNDFYLGGSTEGTEGDYGDIRFGNDGSYATNLTGNLYLRADSKLYSGGTKAILIRGTVTDDVTEHSGSYTLTIQGKGYQFAGDINLTGMTLTDGSEVLLGGETSATTVSVDTVTIGSDGTLTLGNTNATFGTVANNGTLKVNGTTLNLTQSGAVTGNGTLEIGAGSSVSMSASKGSSSVQSNVKVLGGGLLELTGDDALGWGTSQTKMITLLGDGSDDAQLAKMQVTGTQTMKTNLDLQGNSRVSGGALEFYGGAITATGTNNIISSDIYQRNAGTITVTNSGDELEISGNMGHRSNYAALVTKAGQGKLTLSGSANVFYNGFTVSAGNVDLNGRTTVQGTNALTISDGATLNVNAALYITQAIANNGTLTFGNAGALHIADVTQFNGVTESMVDANGEAAETNGFKAVSNITISSGSNKMAGTMVTLDGWGQYEVTQDGTIADLVNYSTYYMNSGEETLSKEAVDSTGMQHVTMSGGALSIGGGSLSTVTMSGGSLAVAGASVETLTMSGGSSVNYAGSITGNVSLKDSNTNFTISGDTTVGGNVETGNSAGASVTVNENATLTVQGSLKSSWGLSSVTVNGTLNITDTAAGLHLASNSNETITGSGTINAGKFTAGNGGQAYTVDVNEFNIGEGGLEFHPRWTTTVNLKSPTTVIEGGVSIRNGSASDLSTLNFGDSETMVDSQATVHGLVNNEATINVNSGSVTLNGGMTGAGTLALKGGQLTLAAGTSNSVGSFSYSGGTLSYESLTAGAINIASGKVMSNSGHLTVTGSLAGSIENTDDGQVTFAKGASIAADTTVSISGTGTTLLAGTLSNAGTLSLAGQLGLSSELQRDYTERSNASEIVYILDKNNPGNTNTNGNGFLKETGSSYWLIQGGDTTLAGDITTSAGYTLTKVTEENKQEGDTVGDVYFTVGSSIGNTFYITSGAVNIVGTGGTKPDGAYNAEAVALNSNEAVLNLVSGSLMTSNITFSESVTDDKAGTITLSDGAVLNVDSLTSMGVTANQLLSSLVSATPATQGATPTGKILISQSGLSTGQITTAFGGTLELTAGVTFTFGEKSASPTNEGYAINTKSIQKVILNDGSRLEYQGNGTDSEFKDLTVNGTGTTGATIYIIDGSNGADSNAVKLTGNTTLNHTLNLTAEYGSRYTISNLKGAGTLNAGGANSTTEFFYTTIKGLDGFTGTLNFTDTSKHTVSVSTGTDADSVSFAALNMAGGTDVNNTFSVQTNTTVGTVSLSGSNNSINLTEGKSLSVGAGTVTNGSLSTGSAVVASKSAETPASLSHVKMTGSGFSAAASANGAKGSISNAQLTQLQADATFTIQDMTLTNTTITAATTTQVNLQNVTASDVVLAQGKFSTNADMAMVGMGVSEGTFSFAGGLANESITINASAGASLTVDLGDLSCVTEMNPGKYNLSITLSGVELDSYTGLSEGAGIKFAGWLGELISASSDVQVSFSEAVAEETPAAAAESGATGVTYSTGSVGTVITITGLNVPEPATSTLSLLALAALAARRRRND